MTTTHKKQAPGLEPALERQARRSSQQCPPGTGRQCKPPQPSPRLRAPTDCHCSSAHAALPNAPSSVQLWSSGWSVRQHYGCHTPNLSLCWICVWKLHFSKLEERFLCNNAMITVGRKITRSRQSTVFPPGESWASHQRRQHSPMLSSVSQPRQILSLWLNGTFSKPKLKQNHNHFFLQSGGQFFLTRKLSLNQPVLPFQVWASLTWSRSRGLLNTRSIKVQSVYCSLSSFLCNQGVQNSFPKRWWKEGDDHSECSECAHLALQKSQLSLQTWFLLQEPVHTPWWAARQKMAPWVPCKDAVWGQGCLGTVSDKQWK